MDLITANELINKYFGCEKEEIKCFNIALGKYTETGSLIKNFALKNNFTDATFCEIIQEIENFGTLKMISQWSGTIWLKDNNWIELDAFYFHKGQLMKRTRHILPQIPKELL